MKVSIYRLPDRTIDVMVEASPGSGKAPVVVRGITLENVVREVLPLIVAQKGRRPPPGLSVPTT